MLSKINNSLVINNAKLNEKAKCNLLPFYLADLQDLITRFTRNIFGIFFCWKRNIWDSKSFEESVSKEQFVEMSLMTV